MVDGSDAKRAHNMVLNVVRTYEYDKPGMYRMEDVEEFRRKLATGGWRCSVHTRDLRTGESTDICNKQRSDGLGETAIITVAPKQLTFIHTIHKAYGGASLNAPDVGVLVNGVGTELAELGPKTDANIEGAVAKLHFEMPKIDARALEQQMQEVQELIKTTHLEITPLQERGTTLEPARPPSPTHPSPGFTLLLK